MNTTNMKKYIFSFLGALLISLITVFVFVFLMLFEEVNFLFSNQIIGNTLLFTASLAVILILAKVYNDGIYNNPTKKISVKSFFSYDKKYVLLVLSLIIISMLFVENIHIITSKISQGHDADIKFSIVDLIGAFTYTPFIEELIFRGIFFNLAFNNLDMEKKIVKYIVIIVNIMCFVVIHYIDYGSYFVSILISLLPKLAISTSLVFVYLKTRDIKYNIILHMLYNFIIIFVSYINY
jgi:membrane protease YdiL (CAAX protease family)